MLALISHRRAVCRGNLVFCSIHRNLSVHRPNTNHSDSLHTPDGAFDMLSPMSHRRAVCRGNLVFCSTHRNLSVLRPNTSHVGVEARSHPRVVHINYFFACFPFFLHRNHGQSSSFNTMLGSVFTVKGGIS